VDIVPSKSEAQKQMFDLDCQVHDDHRAILDADDVDLVSVCTPPYVHAEIAINFLKAGKHVICEKPMAPSLAECDAMIAAASESGKILSPVAQNRFLEPIMNLKRTLDSGLIGKLVHAQIDSHWWRGHPYYDLWWRGTWQTEGGGCTLNHAVHHIDMLGWMMGRPDAVSAMLANTNHDNSEVEDLSVAVMRYPGGALAQVTSSVVHHGEHQQVIFQGEHARVSAPWSIDASVTAPNGFPIPNEELKNKLQTQYDGFEKLKFFGHTGQIENVVSAIENGIENGSRPLVTPADGRLTIELITAIYKAGTEHREIRLPLTADDPFYTVDGIMKSVPHFYEKTASVQAQEGEITIGGKYW
jgi:predicted dehydrogenase